MTITMIEAGKRKAYVLLRKGGLSARIALRFLAQHGHR